MVQDCSYDERGRRTDGGRDSDHPCIEGNYPQGENAGQLPLG